MAARKQTLRTKSRPSMIGESNSAYQWATDLFLVDLLIVVGITIIAGCVILLDVNKSLRVGLGIPLVLFLPGYSLTSALFPGRRGPDCVERIGLAFALSLAILPIVALVIDYSPWTLSTAPVVLALTGIIIIATAITFERRRRLPAELRYRVEARPPSVPHPRTWSRQARTVAALAAWALVLLGTVGVWVISDRIAGDALTEFALYNQYGEPQFYPREIAIGEPVEVMLSIVNHENQTATYELEVAGAGVQIDSVPPITLMDGETWSGMIRFTVTTEGDGLPVRFELRRSDRTDVAEPYRMLQLIVIGKAPLQARIDG